MSLVAGLRGNSWLMKVLDVDNDGKISSADLYQSASKLLHLNMASNTGTVPPGKSVDSDAVNPGGSKLVSGSSSMGSRIATWRMVFVSKVPGLSGKSGSSSNDKSEAQTVQPDVPGEAVSPDDAAQKTSDQRRAANGALRSPAASQAGRLSGRGLAADGLPITDATGGAVMMGNGSAPGAATSGAMAAVAAAAAVAPSASIDIGALGALRKGLLSKQQQQQPGAAGPAGAASGESSMGRGGCPAPLPPGAHVAVDLQQLSGSRSARSAGQGPISAGGSSGQLLPAAAAAKMNRANSAGASMPSNMPLQTYTSVCQWLTESEELPQLAGLDGDSAGWVGRAGPAGSGGACRASTRSLQETASSPGPYVGGSGSMAVQRQQLLQQLQHWRGTLAEEHGVGDEEGEVDIDNLRSVSETEEMLARQQQRRQTGHAAAARVEEITTASQPSPGVAAAAAPPAAVSSRHQPYIALWSNVTIAGPAAAPVNPSRARRTEPAAVAATPAAAASSSSGSARPKGVRPSCFAAVAAGLDAGPATAAGGVSPAVRSASMPGRAHAAGPVAAAAAAAAVAAGEVEPAPPGRHAAYYSLWQSAVARLSEEGLSPPTAIAEAAAAPVVPTAAGPAAALSMKRSATAPPAAPGRHKQYISMWQAVAEEIGDGPSAVGANGAAAASHPAVPVQVAAATAAAQHGRRTSPFAAMAAAAAAAAGQEQQAAAAAVPAVAEEQQQQRQSLQRRRSSRRSRRGGRQSSTAGGVADGSALSDAGSDASAYVGAPVGSEEGQA